MIVVDAIVEWVVGSKGCVEKMKKASDINNKSLTRLRNINETYRPKMNGKRSYVNK